MKGNFGMWFVRYSGVMRWQFLLILLLAAPKLWAQQAYIKDPAGNILFEITDGNVFDQNGKQINTLRGNILFRGVSDKKKDMELLIQSTDIFSAKEGKGLSSDLKETYFSIYKGAFYLEDYPTEDDTYRLGYYERQDDGSYKLYGPEDSLAGTFYGEIQSSAIFTTLFYLTMQENDWTAIVRNRIPQEDVFAHTGTGGTIKRSWNTGDDEFVWDGFTLKRRFNSFDYEEWTFDGHTLKRAWYEGGAEYTWDGKTLRPQWTNSEDEIVWDGSVLKKRWSAADDAYVVQGNIVKKQWDSTGDDEWEIDGDVPIPIIAIIVFDLLQK